MTTTKSVLDDHKLEYELTDGDPKKRMKRKVDYGHRVSLKPTHKLKKMRYNPVKGYLEAIVEVILA